MALVLGAALASGCRSNEPRENGEVVPELKLEGVRFRVYREASLRASGKATAATYRRDTQAVKARALSAVLTGGEGGPVRIEAPRGTGDLARQTFQAEGGLVATRGQDTARTDRAWYVPTPGRGQGLIEGDRPVVVTGPDYRLDGHGFVYDPDLQEIVVTEGAHLETTGARR